MRDPGVDGPLKTPAETDLEMASRHVAEGVARCARQALLVERMAERGYDTIEAKKLLTNFEQTLELMREHQDRLLDDIERSSRTAAASDTSARSRPE
jgi:hypothetical protein